MIQSTTMSQEIEDQIKAGAQTHVDLYGRGYNGANIGKVREADFSSGARFFQQSIMPEEMEKFAEWLGNGFKQKSNGSWIAFSKEFRDNYHISIDDRLTTIQLVTFYLKPKTNGII
jgi:hypothetical protein